MSSGAHKRGLHAADWKLSRQMMDDTERAIMKRRKVVRLYDVPYLAGYSRDGKTIYIDRFMPTGFVYKGRNIRTDRYLVVHEATEKALIDEIGLHYQHAHQIAERAEESAVVADDVPLAVYNDFMNKQIDAIYKRPSFDRCPPDLDLTPLHDEDDQKTIDKMKFAKAA